MDADEVKELRTSLKLSQASFARALNIAVFTVGRWENGRSKPTGLQAEVLRGLRSVVARVSERAPMIGEKLQQGIGNLLADLILKSQIAEKEEEAAKSANANDEDAS